MKSRHFLIGAALLMASAAQVNALPIYAQKEGKTCGYCHVRPTGGGPRNFRGVYYGTHNHSFAGFVDAPTLSRVWEQVLPANPRRVGIADLAGDGNPRLVLLDTSKTSNNVVSIFSWDKEAEQLIADAHLVTDKTADRMEIGRFGQDKSTVIVLPTGFLAADGKTYKFNTGTGAEQLAGSARLKDGTEAFVNWDGEASTWHSVNTKADNGAWVGVGPAALSDQRPPIVWADAHGDDVAQIGKRIGAPGKLEGLPVLAVWDPAGNGSLYYCLPRHPAAGETGGDFVALYAAGQGRNTTPVWTSPPLAGKVLDIAQGPDVKTGKQQGLYVLVDNSPDGKGRTLYFFGLQPQA